MTKYLQNFLAIILVIEIASNENSTFTFPEVAFLCLVERTPLEVSSCFVIKYFYMIILALLYAVVELAELPPGAERNQRLTWFHTSHSYLRIFCNFLPDHRERPFFGDQLVLNLFPG